MIEIRSYHYDPDQFEAYKTWAIDHAAPFLKANLDVVGFWLDNGQTPELQGSDPQKHKHGSANVTWAIRWDSKEARDKVMADAFSGEGWQAVADQHPDLDGYLQIEVTFADEV